MATANYEQRIRGIDRITETLQYLNILKLYPDTTFNLCLTVTTDKGPKLLRCEGVKRTNAASHREHGLSLHRTLPCF